MAVDVSPLATPIPLPLARTSLARATLPSNGMQPAPSKAPPAHALPPTDPSASAMPSRPPSTSPSPPPPPPSPGAAHAPGAMSSGARNATAGGGAGCLPADQSCFALSAGAPYSSRHDAVARACCTTTSYLVVLAISFGSLLAILLVLCAIRWYLVWRSASREAAAADGAPGMDEKRSAGLDADAIAALPEFVYTNDGNGVGEERECTVCLGAMAEGEAARRLPRCMHVFHRGCVDVWLRDHSTCPVCRAEVVARPVGEGCAEKEQEGGASRASTSTSRPPHESSADDGERDLEAQL